MGSRVVGSMDEEVAAFVISKNPGMELGDSPYTAIGNLDEMGNIIGGVVFNNYIRRDVHLHVAGTGRRWITRRFIGEVFRYVFVQLGCRRCTGLVADSNEKALTLDIGLGFVYEGTLRKYLDNDEDCHVLGMLREECRWLKVGELKYGYQHRTPRTPADRGGRQLPAGVPDGATLVPLRPAGSARNGAAPAGERRDGDARDRLAAGRTRRAP